MDILLKNILKILFSKKITDRQFTNDLNLSPSVVSEWKNGKSKSYLKHLPRISDYLGVSTDFLIGNTNSEIDMPMSQEIKIIDDNIEIPIYKMQCGGLAERNIIGKELISKDMTERGDFIGVKIEDNSMSKAGINKNDLVIVQKKDQIEEGNIVCALINNKIKISRYYKSDSGVILSPESSDPIDKPIIINGDIEIIGKVVECRKRF